MKKLLFILISIFLLTACSEKEETNYQKEVENIFKTTEKTENKNIPEFIEIQKEEIKVEIPIEEKSEEEKKLKLKEAGVYKDLQYSSSNSEYTKLDLYSPGLKNAPIIIFIHGGGWRIGDKANGINVDKGEFYSKAGYLTASINYTLYTKENSDDFNYETIFYNAAEAVKYIYDNAQIYGGDNSNITIMGHSAGGHITGLISTNSKYLEKYGLSLKNIKKSILLDAGGLDIPYIKENGNNFERTYKDIFGSDSEILKEASPIYHVEANKYFPSFGIYYSSQREISKSMSTRFYNKLKENNISSILEGYDYTHGQMNGFIVNKDLDYSKSILDFIKK